MGISSYLFFCIAAKPPTLSISHLPKVITVKAGKPLECEIPFAGTPHPKIMWNKDGDALQPHQKTKQSKVSTFILQQNCLLVILTSRHEL